MALRVSGLRAATAIYLLSPVVLFAYGWLRPVFAAPTIALALAVMAGAGLDLFRLVRGAWRQRRNLGQGWASGLAGLIPAGLLLTGWLLLSGAGGLGYQNPDYAASNALLRDLIVTDWPVTFAAGGTAAPLVYYVGYYLPAAAAGKALGWTEANACLWLWTLAGCGLAFAWFCLLARVEARPRAGRLLFLAAIFCLAGGLDYAATMVLARGVPDLTQHTEFWAGYFQYSSNTTLIYWVPQQTIAAWLMISLVMDGLYDAEALRTLGPGLAAGLLWSPFGLLGTLPYLVWLAGVCAAPAARRVLRQPRILLANGAALWIGTIVALYLTANRFHFPSHWIWHHVDDVGRLLRHLFAFWWVEFAGLALLMLLFLGGARRYWRKCRGSSPAPAASWQSDLTPQQWGSFAISAVSLTLLPLYRLGIGNDLAMRASIPALFVLWAFTARVVVDAGGQRPLKQLPGRLRLLHALIVMVVLAGFLPAIGEMARSVQQYRFGPPRFATVSTTAEANPPNVVEQRAGDMDAVFFRYLARQP